MEAIKLEIVLDKIQTVLEKAADEIFKSTYSNPIVDLLEECLKEKDSDVKKIVNEIITSSISSPEFKSRMADVIIQKMVEGALKK